MYVTPSILAVVNRVHILSGQAQYLDLTACQTSDECLFNFSFRPSGDHQAPPDGYKVELTCDNGSTLASFPMSECNVSGPDGNGIYFVDCSRGEEFHCVFECGRGEHDFEVQVIHESDGHASNSLLLSECGGLTPQVE